MQFVGKKEKGWKVEMLERSIRAKEGGGGKVENERDGSEGDRSSVLDRISKTRCNGGGERERIEEESEEFSIQFSATLSIVYHFRCAVVFSGSQKMHGKFERSRGKSIRDDDEVVKEREL